MSTIVALAETLARPGLLGLAGKAVERKCREELAGYFNAIGKRIDALKLGKLAAGDNQEVAKHAAIMRVGNAVRHDRALLKGILQQNIARAYLLGDRLHPMAEADDTQTGTGLQLGQINVTGPRNGIDLVGLTAEQAADYALEQAGSLISGLEQTTIDLISDAVARGIADQLGVEGTSKLIRQIVADMSVNRADLIAATEINDAMSQAGLGKLKRVGVAYKQWIPDPANCCDICADNAAASPIPVDEDFPSGDDAPPAHPRCRCAVAGARAPEDDSEEDQ